MKVALRIDSRVAARIKLRDALQLTPRFAFHMATETTPTVAVRVEMPVPARFAS